ncbi:hypothetical protein BOSEA31B_11297 [Hyphomicrobiales bacterium]|nr:hypothetical protein BOSEA31B_11297 [Hyphomicrobiales bacterium]CAH1697089.1 hypothetical protein BOSEA1005_10126 [Hyphomicrobiales bacterium]CAI0345027.1 hypothetical protein BO1005MUT1_350394 [Hyphomicrobiales bacterium]
MAGERALQLLDRRGVRPVGRARDLLKPLLRQVIDAGGRRVSHVARGGYGCRGRPKWSRSS